MTRSIIDGRMMGHLADFFPQTCTVQSRAATVDSTGQPSGTWSAVSAALTDVACSVADDEGNEYRSSDQTVSVNLYRIVLQGYYSAVADTHRVLMDDGRIFNVLQVDHDQHSTMTRIRAERVL